MDRQPEMKNLQSLLVRGLRKAARMIEGTDTRPIDITDEYVKWVCFANAGMLDRGNLYCFDYAIGHLPSEAPILEIGSFCGLSVNLLAYYKSKRGARNLLITCDKWDFERNLNNGDRVGDSLLRHSEYREFVRETYIRNVRMFSREDLPYTIEGTSDEFFAAWRKGEIVPDILGRTVRLGGPVSFAYIDGNHSYEYVKRDFLNCHEFLDPGGFLLFDDSADGGGWGVCRVVAEIRASGQYELVIRNPNYLFRKRWAGSGTGAQHVF